jgi:undecaprenyl-diphosphatase
MIQALILGILQGVFEWLPVSSEAILVVVGGHLFPEKSLADLVGYALVLHAGTTLAAIVYFRNQVLGYVKVLLSLCGVSKKEVKQKQKKELVRYAWASLVTLVVGYVLFSVLVQSQEVLEASGKVVNLIVAGALFVTAYLQFSKKTDGKQKEFSQTSIFQSLALGFSQALAVIPGISRSGTTTAVLLMQGVREREALAVSFILSIPVVIGGNIILGEISNISTLEVFVAISSSFVFGLATIHGLLKLVKKIQFGWFALVFGALMVVAAFL